MRPPLRHEGGDFERVPKYGDWISGEIEDVTLEEDHEFKGKFAKVGDAVRFKFKLEGCQFPHYSNWMSYNYSEKSNLYKKYLRGLVEGAKPNMEFDLDRFKNIQVKTMWETNGDFDNLSMIRPRDKKLDPKIPF